MSTGSSADIFNRTASTNGGSFAADKATMTFSGLGGSSSGSTSVGTLVQQVQVSYQQNVTKLYEVGSTRVYFVGGRTQGQGSMGRVIGPAPVSVAFYQSYGDICNIKNNVINFGFTADCGTSGGSSANYSCGLVILNSVGFSVAAQDMLINEQVGFMFSVFNATAA